MTRPPLDPRLLTLIRTLETRGTLTRYEVDAYAYHAAGYGYRTIARHLGISWTTARDRVCRARLKISTAIHDMEPPDAA